MGIAWNMNRVRELSSGEYFKWAGSYDYVAPTFISACKQILDSDPAVVLAYPLAQVIDEHSEIVERVVSELIDTRGLPTFARVTVAVAKIERGAFELYGLFRMAALKRCRPLKGLIANDLVLMVEISVLGAIALVPELLFHRRDFGPVWSGDEAMAKAMLRVNPGASKRKHMRPFWALGIQQLAGAWRLTPLTRAFYLLPLIAHTHYFRWRTQLKRELRRPYSLSEHKEVEF